MQRVWGHLIVLGLIAAACSPRVTSDDVRSAPSIQDPGQPLAGVRMECMTPRAAAALLDSRGFTDVRWQVESADGSVTIDEAPAVGIVTPGAILSDGRLHMIVDQRPGVARPVGCAPASS
jgi:hypothetical protein